MLSNVTHTRIELLNHKACTAFRCQSPAISPQLYQGQFSHLLNVSCNLTVRFKSASARCRSQRVSVLHSRLIAAPSHAADLEFLLCRNSFHLFLDGSTELPYANLQLTIVHKSLTICCDSDLLPYSTVRLCAFQRRIPASLESTFITETDGYVTLLIIILIKLNPPSIVGFSPVSTLLFSNSNNWRSEDCIVLSFISEAFAYRLKEEAPEMDVRCKFR
ncbi:hypothetical protein T03_13628 [Trichinella britovi]|uniref:Uncharacterized protein n=1 Tax=Trichinella britovi TaxID=45882 RepID=A0A0V1C817_TRIBR|nr:hypothetical protein T03_13628 [Trichinella britovi]